jgi:hypothetical protein
MGIHPCSSLPSSDEKNYATHVTPDEQSQTYRIRCAWLSEFEKRKGIEGWPFASYIDSLEKCIELCKDFNMRNGTGLAEPCITATWRILSSRIEKDAVEAMDQLLRRRFGRRL